VQRRLTGPRQFRRGAYEIACEIFAVRQISGDFFCAFDVGEVTIFAFGDVAGKGLAAGMWVNHIASLVRKYGKLFPHPARIATLINDDLADIPSGAPITTMFIAVLDPALHRVTYCNAGHPAPLLVRSDDVARLEVGGPVLGAVSTANYESSAIGLAPRDMIVCYSDGLSEARGSNGEEFGMERLISEAQCATRQPLSSSLFSIFGAVQDFAGATRRDDDMSLAILRRTDIPR
jgi:sigma-B regulation protein RsbU (phosphoserine phosphatase)